MVDYISTQVITLNNNNCKLLSEVYIYNLAILVYLDLYYLNL